MTELILWKDQEMNRVRQTIDRLFDRFCTCFGVPAGMINKEEVFSIDFSETADAVLLTAQLPGVRREDIQITVTENLLTIRGETTTETVEEDKNGLRVESRSKTFSRTVSLPSRVNADRIEATYKDGALKISMPKQDPGERRSKPIEIK